MTRTILITGAAGFIGAHLGNHLTELGHHVLGMDNYFHATNQTLRFKCENVDIVKSPEYIAIRSKDIKDTGGAIVHLAAVINIDNANEFPEYAQRTNIDGTFNILNIARKMDIPVVFASSSEVYGSAQATAISETHPLDAQSPYAASKVASDRMCKAWAETYGMNINIVRLFNTFGPFQAADGYGGVIARFVAQGMQGLPMTIYGEGKQERDYLYISDAVEAYVLALNTRFNGPVNFGCGKPVSILNIAETVYEHVGGNPKTPWIHIDPRPGEVDRLCCDNRKAHAMGWSPAVSFEDGIRKYVDWRRYTLFP